jgi:hypothetical protein
MKHAVPHIHLVEDVTRADEAFGGLQGAVA